MAWARSCLVVLVLGVATALIGASPARASTGALVPTTGEAALDELSTPAGDFGAVVSGPPASSGLGAAGRPSSLDSATIDAEVISVEVRSDTMVSRFEEASGRLSRFGFDPLGWQARASGVVATFVERRTYQLREGAWQLVSSSDTRSTASISLVWRGTGAPELRQSVEPVGTCTDPPGADEVCLPSLHASRWRRAAVSGSISFYGLGVSVNLSSDAAGWMAYGAP